MKALRKIQSELDEQKNTILKTGDRVTEQVTLNLNSILEEKFKSLETKCDHLKEQLDNQDKRLYFLEKQSRQRNIVFFGLEETESSYSGLESILADFIKKHFSIQLERRDIQAVRRIGKKGEKARPIIATFSTLGLKIDLYKKRRVLNSTGYYLTEDYPQNVLEKRKQLQEQLRIEKEKGNTASIKYDKIIIHSKNPKSTNNNKRMLSLSPESNVQSQEEPRVQTSKKNKTHGPLKRTSSLSEGISKSSMLDYLVAKNLANTPKQDKTNIAL